MAFWRWLAFGAIFLSGCLAADGQVDQIDRTKLPPDAAVQAAYLDALTNNPFARTYEMSWRFPTPKEQLAVSFTRDLHALEDAQKKSPGNVELELLTGLVAHLAYNLNVDEGYTPAIDLLGTLARNNPQDYRAAWFLGIHQCQSNDTAGGMKRLLGIESTFNQLPRAFWQDYANCASVSLMPEHAIRAYDNAHKVLSGPPNDETLERIARKVVKPSSPDQSYPIRTAWAFAQTKDQVRFTSTLCGESFVTRPDARVELHDVKNGTCAITIESPHFTNRHGESSANRLILTMIPKPGESLEDFAHRFLSGPKYSMARPITGVPCPVARCIAFEIVTDKLYPGEGGAHLISVFFASDEPQYPGLIFEQPQAIPTSGAGKDSDKPTFYRANEGVSRFSGTLYTFVALDANADIYAPSRALFDGLLKSLVVDAK